jgi:hypothetical protein
MTPSGVGGPKAGGHSRTVFGLCFGRLSGGSTCLDRPLGWGGRLHASGNGLGGLHASPAFCMVTVSMDRNIGVWAVSPSAGEGGVAGVSCSLMKMVPTLGGYPYDVECCAMDPYRVAIALGDHTIRVWHTDSAAEPFKSTLLWRYMSWHMVAFSCAVFARSRECVLACVRGRERVLRRRRCRGVARARPLRPVTSMRCILDAGCEMIWRSRADGLVPIEQGTANQGGVCAVARPP